MYTYIHEILRTYLRENGKRSDTLKALIKREMRKIDLDDPK